MTDWTGEAEYESIHYYAAECLPWIAASARRRHGNGSGPRDLVGPRRVQHMGRDAPPHRLAAHAAPAGL